MNPDSKNEILKILNQINNNQKSFIDFETFFSQVEKKENISIEDLNDFLTKISTIGPRIS